MNDKDINKAIEDIVDEVIEMTDEEMDYNINSTEDKREMQVLDVSKAIVLAALTNYKDVIRDNPKDRKQRTIITCLSVMLVVAMLCATFIASITIQNLTELQSKALDILSETTIEIIPGITNSGIYTEGDNNTNENITTNNGAVKDTD